MDEAEIKAVRRFNRIVTERIGALDEAYLAHDRSLGASRLLWEVGSEGSDARELRARLGLDSGYLSRLLRSLEREGLVTVKPDPSDKRVRSIRLSDPGRAELDLLDRQSDDLASSMLAPLSDSQRARLLEAMAVVEQLLKAGMIEIEVEDAASEAAQFCIGSYFRELDTRFDTGFDPQQSISANAAELTPPAGLLLVARLRGEPIGCGALKLHPSEPAEIKRMWVANHARGLGLGRRILAELEQHAGRRGVDVVRLETNQSLNEAIALYRSAGYVEVPRFSDEPYAHHWFEKRLEG